MGSRGRSLTLSFGYRKVRSLPFHLFKEPSFLCVLKARLLLETNNCQLTKTWLWCDFLPRGLYHTLTCLLVSDLGLISKGFMMLCSLKDKDQSGDQHRSIQDSCQVALLWGKNMDTDQRVSLSTDWISPASSSSVVWGGKPHGSACGSLMPQEERTPKSRLWSSAVIISYWIISGKVLCLSSCSLVCPQGVLTPPLFTRQSYCRDND